MNGFCKYSNKKIYKRSRGHKGKNTKGHSALNNWESGQIRIINTSNIPPGVYSKRFLIHRQLK